MLSTLGRYRLWSTGGRSVLAAAARWSQRLSDEYWISLRSRFPVDETIRRIERQASRRGLMPITRMNIDPAHRSAAKEVLVVLGLDSDTSPVLQDLEQGTIELPLGLWIRSGPDGGTTVMYHTDHSAAWSSRGVDVPDELRLCLAGMGELIGEAMA